MSNVQTLPDPEETPETLLAQYKEEIKYYEKESQAWDERARKILKRYKDERSPREMRVARFNILYSNVQTLLPAIYGKNPKADIERRFKDKDPIGRVTSDVLERCTDFFTNTEAFRSSLRAALFDRLTAGRGSTWARYVPHFRDVDPLDVIPEEKDLGVEIGNDVEEMSEAENTTESLEEVYHEEALVDYVHWGDLGHNWARMWDEIWLLWRKVYMTRQELVARFGEEIAKTISLDYFPKGLNDQKKETTQKKAVIYECWDKKEKKVRWLHKDCSEFLDEKDDPLKLPDFFPAPKPLYAVLANDTMIPVPDYTEYQDQANELDELTSRIAAITKAVKIAGVYDASAQGVERVLAEGVENKLIPVDQWAALAEKGGMAGVMSLLPIENILKTLLGLYECRDKVKADLYEITGIADIIRGGGDPSETATGVNAKGRFATLRLSDAQDDMSRFARDSVKNIAVIIANHFSIDTIKKISGVKLLTDMEKQQIQAQQQQQMAVALHQAQQQHAVQAQQAQQQGQQAPQFQPPAPAPIDPDMQEMLEDPTWEQIEQLLRDEPELTFKIDIEIDSTIKMDEEAEKAARVDFLEATGKFLSAMQEAPPIAQPLLAHLLQFGVRGFRVGKEVEAQFNIFCEKLEKQASQAPVTPPNPEMIKVQADIQEQQARSQADRADSQAEMQMKMEQQKQEFQFKMQEMQQKYDLELRKIQADGQIKQYEINSKASADLVNQMHERNNANQMDGRIDVINNNAKSQHEAQAKAMMDSSKAVVDALGAVGQHLDNIHKNTQKPKTVSMQGRDGRLLTAKIT